MKRKLLTQPCMLSMYLKTKYSASLTVFCLVVMTGVISCGPPPPPTKSNQPVTSTPVKEEQAEVMADINEKDAAYFLRELTNLKSLASYREGERVISFTSHHPENGEYDSGNFFDVYEEDGKNWKVMVDVDGPGLITRMFFNNDITGTLKFFFDHQAEPAIVTTFEELYQNDHELFSLYTAYGPERSGNGFSSYFPMPFENHCMVVTDAETVDLKYQFDIRLLPLDTELTTFTGKLDQRTAGALKKYNDFVVTNAVGRFEQTILGGFTDHVVKAGTTKLVANDTGPAAVQFFAVDLNPVTRDTLESVYIKMYWDDLQEASVDLPLRDFFAANIGVIDSWNSTPIGHYPTTESFPRGFFYSQFYMPFQKKAQILFENKGKQDVTVRFVRKVDFSPLPENPLFFFARNDQRDLPMGLIFPFFEFEGKGNFVGLSQSIMTKAPLDPVNFALEGDPYIYINGEKEPSIQGSGMDNYFNTHSLLKFYTPFWLPTHGCLLTTQEQPGYSHTFRFHYLDAVSFDTSIFMMQEIGDPGLFAKEKRENQILANYQWTCYWYGKIAEEPVTRNENVYYYAFNRAPAHGDALMKDFQLYLQLPPGEWTMQYAPIWDLSKISQQVYQVQ